MNQVPERVETAYIGIGGNVGDVRTNLQSALSLLDETPHVSIVGVSDLYRTPPWGLEDQDWFLNACAKLRTRLSPTELLDQCLEVEKKLKRVRGERWGPRTIDIDVLMYDEITVKTDNLELPHPRMADRAFVLLPLSDLDPGMDINGASIAKLLKTLDGQGIERVAKATDWWPVE